MLNLSEDLVNDGGFGLSLEFEPVRCRAFAAWAQLTPRCGRSGCFRINPVCRADKLKVTFRFHCCLCISH